MCNDRSDNLDLFDHVYFGRENEGFDQREIKAFFFVIT